MENHMIDPPEDPFDRQDDDDPYEDPPAAVISEPLYRNHPLSQIPTMYASLCDEYQRLVATVAGDSWKEVDERALLYAAAPALYDIVKAIHDGSPITDRQQVLERVLRDAEGIPCQACERLGQPSRMRFDPRNSHAYHPDCTPEEVRTVIAKADAAASQDDGTPF